MDSTSVLHFCNQLVVYFILIELTDDAKHFKIAITLLERLAYTWYWYTVCQNRGGHSRQECWLILNQLITPSKLVRHLLYGSNMEVLWIILLVLVNI